MTLNEIRNAFTLKFNREKNKRKLDYELPADKEIALLISEAQQDLQRRLSIVQSSTTITTVSGTSAYNLPTNFGKHKLVKIGGFNPLDECSISEIKGEYQFSGQPTKYAIDPQNTSQIILYPTPDSVYTVTVYYMVDSLYYSPSGATSQDWGSFDGNDFSGNLILPERYSNAIQKYMLGQYFYELEESYERELRSLRESQIVSTGGRKYRMGGLTGKYKSGSGGIYTSTTSSGDGEVYTKHYISHATEGVSTVENIKNTFGGITASVASNVITLTSSGEFTEGKVFVECVKDHIWSRTSDSEIQITIYPASGWTNASIEVYIP